MGACVRCCRRSKSRQRLGRRSLLTAFPFGAPHVFCRLNKSGGIGIYSGLMRVFLGALILWCVAVQGQDSAVQQPIRFNHSGQQYVSFEVFAKANEFETSRAELDVRMTNEFHQLAFKLNAQRAEIDGITVFMAFPILLRQDTICIAQKDLDLSLRPILYPRPNRPAMELKTVALSAGHGGKDVGYQVGNELEKTYTLLLAEELKRLLSTAGFKPVLIRDSDVYLAREERTRMAKRAGADVYLDLHYNSAPSNPESKGVEVYCLTPHGAISTNGGGRDEFPATLAGNRHDQRNMLFAYQMQKALVTSAAMADRGVRRARFEVLRDATMPAVLIEGGFMSHPDELKRIQDSAHRQKTAEAIVEGLLAYKRITER